MNFRALISAGLLQPLAAQAEAGLPFESVVLAEAKPAITIHLIYRPGIGEQHPVILMLGTLKTNEPPSWATGLVHDGWMHCAFATAYEPDPDPARRPQWLDSWEPNGLWRGGSNGRWPETDELLAEFDPILYATNLWPTATTR